MVRNSKRDKRSLLSLTTYEQRRRQKPTNPNQTTQRKPTTISDSLKGDKNARNPNRTNPDPNVPIIRGRQDKRTKNSKEQQRPLHQFF